MRQILLAASIGLVVTLFGTPVAIRLLIRRNYGQLIRDDGPTSHHTKRGTPTMGGAVIIVGALLGYFLAHLITWRELTISGVLVLYLMTGLGLVGFLDDYIKVSKQRSLGLKARSKLIGQSIVAISFAVLALRFPDPSGYTPASTKISFIRDTGIVLGSVAFVVWAYLMIAATSNGVNLADGLDGLATGTSVMVFASYVLIGVWQFGENCASADASQNCYEVRDPLDLAVVAAALMGACFGFLWWNASPAKIFMGDTGSLALGGALAGLAILSRTELLLVLLGGLFVLITLSVIVQVGFFKLTQRRVFRMAPLQHHFELVGWGEVTIVIRFWIIAGLLVALGLGVFYAEWVTGAGALMSSWELDARAEGAWAGVSVCVAGIGVSGAAVARALAAREALVVVVDGREGPDEQARADQLRSAGCEVRLGAHATETVPAGAELVVTSPGWRPDQPLLVAAARHGIPVWGEVELAWRLRDPAVPWLGVTGTNGKTTTVEMLAAVLRAAGRRSVAAGNVGLPLLDAVLAQPAYDVLAVELSSFQLHWTHTVRFRAAAVLNVAPDHLDWHGSIDAYADTKARIWRGEPLAVFNADDATAARLAADVPGAISFTLREPAPGQLGVRAGWLVDAAWPGGGTSEPVPSVRLAPVSAVHPPAPHNVANALAASALARAIGVPAEAIAAGLESFEPGGHRIAPVATVGGVDYVDDSKATNPHAATASLLAFDRVVWVAGGLAKGARFEEVVAATAGRLRGAVLMGQDRALVAEALARHAPDVPVVDVPGTDTGAMDDVVRAAAGLARPGDTVLLAPACASMDMFRDYAERGDAFAASVRRLSA